MTISDQIRDLVTVNASVTALRKQAEKEGMKSLKEDGFEKAIDGLTSIEEVARVTEVRIDVGKREEISPEEKIAAEKEEKKAGVGFIRPEKRKEAPGSFASKTIDLREYREKISNWLAKK